MRLSEMLRKQAMRYYAEAAAVAENTPVTENRDRRITFLTRRGNELRERADKLERVNKLECWCGQSERSSANPAYCCVCGGRI